MSEPAGLLSQTCSNRVTAFGSPFFHIIHLVVCFHDTPTAKYNICYFYVSRNPCLAWSRVVWYHHCPALHCSSFSHFSRGERRGDRLAPSSFIVSSYLFMCLSSVPFLRAMPSLGSPGGFCPASIGVGFSSRCCSPWWSTKLQGIRTEHGWNGWKCLQYFGIYTRTCLSGRRMNGWWVRLGNAAGGKEGAWHTGLEINSVPPSRSPAKQQSQCSPNPVSPKDWISSLTSAMGSRQVGNLQGLI